MGALIRYTLTLVAEQPPQIYVGAEIGGARVLKVEAEELPRQVGTAWLMERFTISKSTLIARLRPFNIGTNGKHLYDPNVVLPVLNEQPTSKRGRKRRN